MLTSFLKLSLMAVVTFSVMTPVYAATSRKQANAIGYETLDKAAVAALLYVIKEKLGNKYEYGGCLYKSGGRYYYTTPVTERERNEFSASCELNPLEDQFVGLFHNHPSGAEVGFSGHDVNVANQLRVPSYIAIQERGVQEIVRYVPGRTKLQCEVYRNGEVVEEFVCARGDLVTRYQ